MTAYTAFATSVEKSEYRKAYETLSTDTRKLLEERARKLHADSGGAVKDDPAALFFSANVQAPLTGATLVSNDGQRAVLHVRSRRGEQDLTMVREDSGWKLDLTEALHE